MDEQFMFAAIQEASKAKENGDLPFGAIVVHNKAIVGKGRAENNTTGDVTAHAELNALREACKSLATNNLKECTIYCTNEPCVMCAAGIFQAKISHVFIGASREDLSNLLRPRKINIATLAEDSGYEIKIERGICKDKVVSLFKDIKK